MTKRRIHMVFRGAMTKDGFQCFTVTPRLNENIVGIMISGDAEVSISKGVEKAMIQVPNISSLSIEPDLRVYKTKVLKSAKGKVKALDNTLVSVYVITEKVCR